MNFLLGLLVGVLGTAVSVFKLLPKLMLTVHKSKLGFEETVAAIDNEAKARQWKVPKIYDIQKTLQESGHEDMTRVKILSICQPHHAYNVLKNDADKFVTAIMPCRVAVYEDAQGNVNIAEMNMGLMSQFFSPTVRNIIGKHVAIEEKEMLANIVE
ncbi:MAG: DUF302 domain-containing protein [Ardenticatenaceae bacterium]|nr:DUF302 domain-containing protein [Anaerolineales bacterium]MCB8920257.1 DUF302 domain-containing protein [Ardenticatenaceae bacterium]MCB8991990.1 DUF302 domain-containing protein [Ardenticatenaceae bacterium]MCB9004929.1 DUF302 domain-containing protein [Ardenticatenaceae bacterium]